MIYKLGVTSKKGDSFGWFPPQSGLTGGLTVRLILACQEHSLITNLLRQGKKKCFCCVRKDKARRCAFCCVRKDKVRRFAPFVQGK